MMVYWCVYVVMMLVMVGINDDVFPSGERIIPAGNWLAVLPAQDAQVQLHRLLRLLFLNGNNLCGCRPHGY